MKFLSLLFLGCWWLPPCAAQISANPTVAAVTEAHIQVSPRWWESAAALRNVTLKDDAPYPQLSLQPRRAEQQLKEIKQQGFTGIQVFGPADGGKSYGGLDTRDHYRIEPKYGTVEDFRQVVQIAHRLGMPVIIFDNLGYSSLEAPSFLKACDDVREGRDSKEVHWFFWSDAPDAPAPASGDTFFMVRPTRLAGYQPLKTEHWVYSERAKHYYWTRWPGKDAQGNRIDLPQYNWLSREWQEEAEKIVRFWMDTGIDGMVLDAVNWYVGFTWDIGHKRITDVIRGYGEKYSQPEGAGGFHEDPVAWITEGGWNSVQNYGLNLWWEKSNIVLKNAIETSDPRPIEESLRNYHDRVVAAGGTLNMTFPKMEGEAQQHLAAAIVATTGHLITDWSGKDDKTAADPEIQWLLKTKAAHPALFQLASRRQLPCQEPKEYAFLRAAVDGAERILVVTNFATTTQTVEIDTSGLNAKTLRDLKTGETIAMANPLRATIGGYGYRLFSVQ
ncbi:MAG: alpha-amylase family glycosyl hydrolase [Terriglobales bacterium]